MPGGIGIKSSGGKLEFFHKSMLKRNAIDDFGKYENILS